MTPLGEKLRALRAARGVTMKEMAEAIGVSGAYLSALEHGKRGTPTWFLIQRIITYFNLIWDEAEQLQELAEMSDPRVTVDTAGMEPAATHLANRLAQSIKHLTADDCMRLTNELETLLAKGPSSNSKRMAAE